MIEVITIAAFPETGTEQDAQVILLARSGGESIQFRTLRKGRPTDKWAKEACEIAGRVLLVSDVARLRCAIWDLEEPWQSVVVTRG